MSKKVTIVAWNEFGEKEYETDYFEHIESGNNYIYSLTHGNSLLDILTQERSVDEDLQLSYVLTSDVNYDLARIMGNIAEALVVNECNIYPKINRHLARIARKGNNTSSFLDRFIAIGTGLELTKNSETYKRYYQPNDTQRDILWVDRRNVESQLTQPNVVGAVAGLQVKASHDWRYVASSISDYHYPVLYFDLANDWGNLNNSMKSNNLNCDLIYPSDEIIYLKEKLKGYYNILGSLIRKELSLKRLMDICKYNNDLSLGTGLELSFNSVVTRKRIIIPE